MSLNLVRQVLSNPAAPPIKQRMSVDAWISDWEIRGKHVQRFRDYYSGAHDANLSDEMAKMLRASQDNDFDRFNDNYCGKVVNYMNDRLRIRSIDAENDEGQEWIKERLNFNRFDALQIDTHEAALCDADTCLLVQYDNDAKMAKLTHEPVWDGSSGMLLVKDSMGNVQAAIKVWQESRESLGDTTRITVYYEDRLERWISGDGSALHPYVADEQPASVSLMFQGRPMGVPVFHLRNRGGIYGQSELADVIPLQNALNREMQSLIMASELTAFQVKVAVGFKPPSGVAPGDWIGISDAPISSDEHEPKAYTLDMGEVIPYIQACDFFAAQISQVSDTPLAGNMGADAQSGEALKQREIGLLGKVERFQVRNGNVWEDVIRMMARVEQAYANSTSPDLTILNAQWNKPEIRNDKEVVDNAILLDGMGYHEEALRQMAQVFDWSEEKILELLTEKRDAQRLNFQDMTGDLNMPTFETNTIGGTI